MNNWITKAGKCLLCNSASKVPERVLRNIIRIIDARSTEVVEKRFDAAGALRNQQVVCSSHITSSKNPPKSADFGGFLCGCGGAREGKTHAAAHTGKYFIDTSRTEVSVFGRLISNSGGFYQSPITNTI